MLRQEKKSKLLADTISNILSAAPSSIDPENDEDYEAKVTEGSLEYADNEVLLSTFRKQNIDFLEDVDIKYAGKKGDRSNLKHEDFTINVQTQAESDNLSEIESTKDSSDEFDSNDEKENSDDLENVDDDENSTQSDMEEDVSDLPNDSFKRMNDSDTNTQIQKGSCLCNQLTISEKLLEIRIQLQKCLLISNKMPQSNIFKEIRKQSGKKFNAKVNETKNTVENVLNKLLELQLLLLKQYPETKNLLKTQRESKNDEISDEEIMSDTDEENDEMKENPRKKCKLSDYANEIKNTHNIYSTYRNSVIQKWNDKTQIAVNKNNNLVHSVLNQIEHVLSDKQKLIKRTQTKRSNYKVVGQKSDSDEERISEINKENDVEIFDDDDFYYQLLRELIERKSANVTDPVQLGRQWIQLQNMRSKMKREIDTRATKGRKIRYTVHNKLVNFMSPIDNKLYTEEAKTELFNSLFGRNQQVNNF